jgi:hypothetical protein
MENECRALPLLIFEKMLRLSPSILLSGHTSRDFVINMTKREKKAEKKETR